MDQHDGTDMPQNVSSICNLDEEGQVSLEGKVSS